MGIWQRVCTAPVQEDTMLLALAILLAILWLLGFTAFHVTSLAIHLLILAAVIAAIAHFVAWGTRRGPTVTSS